MKFKNVILTMLITIPCAMFVSGCGSTDWATRDIPDGSSLDEGDLVTIVQKNGDTQTGTYRGITSLSPSEYAELYSHSEKQLFDGKLLPRLSQKIRIITTISDSRIWQGELVGFDCSSLWMKPENSKELEQIYFTSLRCMSARDYKVFHRMHLRELFMDGDIPLISAIEIEDAAGSHRISISSVDHIRLNGSGLEISAHDVSMMIRK